MFEIFHHLKVSLTKNKTTPKLADRNLRIKECFPVNGENVTLTETVFLCTTDGKGYGGGKGGLLFFNARAVVLQCKYDINPMLQFLPWLLVVLRRS